MTMIKKLCWLVLLWPYVTCAMASDVPPAVLQDLAPRGRLRVAINFGNPVLAQKDPATGEPRGVSAELARELGQRLGSPVEFVTFDSAGSWVTRGGALWMRCLEIFPNCGFRVRIAFAAHDEHCCGMT